jgi:ADP-ribosyl-[dinitrogen reductase] hydrolase
MIAEVCLAISGGKIGVTFCPGKKQSTSFTGGWDRDLCIDLDAMASWGAAAVVTLVEEKELADLGVLALGAEVQRRHMQWFHLPIVDVSVPCSRFESEWAASGASLRALLREGFSIVVHCKGGLGRAGMIAARLMVELGAPAEEAIGAVRAVRRGAIETPAQVRHVLATKQISEQAPSMAPDAVHDRAVGALLGLAVGDAVGTTLEFRSRDSFEPLTDMVGGGPFRLQAGQWTDDTAMALALADSLIACGTLDELDLMGRFVSWRVDGVYSCTGTCFDIGNTVSAALNRFKRTGDPIAGSTDPHSAGNGSLMRLAPVALACFRDRVKLADFASRQSRTTHAAPEAVVACELLADMLADAIQGLPRSEILRDRSNLPAGKIGEIAAGAWRGKLRPQIGSSGYVAHTLEAAIWSVARTTNFRDAVLAAANLGGDADTTGAVAGQLAGAIYGASAIPETWLMKLAMYREITCTGEQLLGLAGGEEG